LASVRRDAPDSLRPERCEVNHVVGAPACPDAIPGGADIVRDASGDSNLFQFALGKEADPLAVRRKEWVVGVFAARNERWLKPVQRTPVEL